MVNKKLHNSIVKEAKQTYTRKESGQSMNKSEWLKKLEIDELLTTPEREFYKLLDLGLLTKD